MQNNNNNNNNNPRQQKRKFDIMFFIIVAFIIVGVFMLIRGFTNKGPTTFTYDEFIVKVENGSINKDVTATPAGGDNLQIYTIEGSYVQDGKTIDFVMNVTYDVLNEIIENAAYKTDYNEITALLIFEKLEYEEAITALKKVKEFLS